MAPVSSNSKESGLARFAGSASAGVLELLGFHPVDTIAKRLMNNRAPIFGQGISFKSGLTNLNDVIFAQSAKKSFGQKYLSLFPGLGFAAGYKVLQRIYKFGGQPYLLDYFNKHYKNDFANIFGEQHAKTVMHATAGSIIGVGEIFLLPLDALKIKKQANPASIAGKNVFQIFREEGFNLYRGALWTAGRNAPGSFALFGGSAVVKEHVFGLSDYSKATFFQNFVASIGGAVASITISAPLDVVKTRIQAQSSSAAQSGALIVAQMVKNEGLGSFFKGLLPKVLVVGPKLVFSFTVAQQLIPFFNKALA